jgi:hypothetical protein
MDRAYSTYGESRGAYWVLVGRPEGRRQLERPRSRWEDNIKMDLREVGWDMDWIHLAQGRDRWWAVANAGMNLHILLNAGNSLTVENLLAPQECLLSME